MIVDPSSPDPLVVLPSLRPGLGRAAKGLVGYGIVGSVAAVLGIVFLLLGLARINGLADRVGAEFGGVTAVLDRTATVLDKASTTAHGFGGTVDESTAALTTAADDVRAIVPRLRELETQANSVNVLGSQPLAPLAGLFGQIAGQLGDLDGRLDTVSKALATNRSALDDNATSLADLATETRTLSGRLGAATLASVIDDARWLIVALLGVASVGALVPAIGALLAGLWLRRLLDTEVSLP